MKLNLSILSEKELNTRKLWRRCFIAFMVIYTLALLAGFSFCATRAYLESGASIEGIVVTLVLALIVCFLLPCLFYHFAYRKAGIILLTLFLCMRCIGTVTSAIIFLFLPFPFNLLVTPLVTGINVFIIVMCWKLLNINKILRFNGAYPEDYLLELDPLMKASPEIDLKVTYSNLVKKWPQFERHLTAQYKKTLETSQQCTMRDNSPPSTS